MSFYPNGVVVAGFTEADIDAAVIAAGVNGTVLFPSGLYEVNSLKAPLSQSWVFQKGAVLRSSATTVDPIIEIASTANLNIVGGEFDGNRDLNPNLKNGISAFDGAGLTMSGDFLVRDVSLVGIWGRDGSWDIRDGEVRNTGYWGIYWASISYSNGRRKAPRIQRVKVDRGMVPIVAGMGGGICISGGPLSVIKESRDAEISDNYILLPLCTSTALRDTAYDSVAIEVNYCYMPILTRNRLFGSRIGVSTQTCPWAIQSLNQGSTIGDYLIEMVNCEFGSAVGNMGTGAGAGIAHCGISISGTLSKGLNITGNNCKMLFATPLVVASGAGGGSYPHTISGNN